MTVTKIKTGHPGIKKVIRANGETVYRLIVSLNGKQRCYTFDTLAEAVNTQAQLKGGSEAERGYLRALLDAPQLPDKSWTARQPFRYGCAKCGEPLSGEHSQRKFCRSCKGSTKGDEWRLHAYGVSRPEWLEMLAVHGGKCWVCREADAKVVDHCHATGRVRGALCNGCNAALAVFDKPYAWRIRALAYLGLVTE